MPKAYDDTTARILSLRAGQSCVVRTNRPDRQITTARKYEPNRCWKVESVDGAKLVIRVK